MNTTLSRIFTVIAYALVFALFSCPQTTLAQGYDNTNKKTQVKQLADAIKDKIKAQKDQYDIFHNEIQDLANRLPNDKTGNEYTNTVTPRIFDTLITNYQNQVSGSYVKDGKVRATSVYVDGKSLTANFNLAKIPKFFGHTLLLQPTITGNADSGIVNVFSKGDYNPKAFTYGLNLFFFTNNNKGKYYQSDKVQLLNSVKAYEKFYDASDNFKTKKDALLNLFKDLKSQQEALYNTDHKIDATTYKSFTAFDQLYKIYKPYLPKDFDAQPYEWELQALLDMEDKLDDFVNLLILKTKVDYQDSLQKNAYWSVVRMSWFSGSVKRNISSYKVFDPSNSAKLYASDFNDSYWSASFSFNIFSIHQNYNFWFSPTLKFKHNRDFDPTSATNGLITIQKDSLFNVGSQQVSKTKTSSYYRNLADIKRSLTIEAPFGFYLPKKGFGFELIAGGEVLPTWDNAYFKTGIFVPFEVSSKTTLTLEPYAKFEKLFKGLSFKDEVFSFGISLSVTLPTIAATTLK